MKLFGKKVANQWAGFTLIEALLALLVVGIICSSFSALFRLENKLNADREVDTAIDWHLFLTQLENSSGSWEYQEIKDGGIEILFTDTTDADFPIYISLPKSGNDSVLRKKKKGGYEPVLFRVEQVLFSEEPNKVKLRVVMKDGRRYEAEFNQWYP